MCWRAMRQQHSGHPSRHARQGRLCMQCTLHFRTIAGMVWPSLCSYYQQASAEDIQGFMSLCATPKPAPAS